MSFTAEDVERNRVYFLSKLRAEKQKSDVVHKVKDGMGDFLLLDVRPRMAFRKAHVLGAWCAPYEELSELVGALPRERELVTYCWNDY